MDNTTLQAIWPEWQIVRCIKNDEMTSVYKVSRMHHNRKVYAAVKVISVPKDFYSPSAQKIFDLVIERIRLMESLKSIPNIVTIDDYHAAEWQDGSGWDIFIRMEYLTSLAAYIEANAISEAEIIRLGQDLCSALEMFRKREDSCTLPFAHCNIKPENVFVDEYGFWKLGDFGIAKALQRHNTPTSCYIAPEVLYDDYNYTADICSLGVLMYTLLNKGRIPFQRTDQKSTLEDFEQAFQKRMDGKKIPPPCDASPEMANIILRACAHHLSHRFQSIMEMKDALTRLDQNIYQVIPIATEKEPITQPCTDPVIVPLQTVTPSPASAQPEPAPQSGRYFRLILSAVVTILTALMVLVIILLFKMMGLLEENSSQNAGIGTTVPAVVATESTTEVVISTETEDTTTTAVSTTETITETVTETDSSDAASDSETILDKSSAETNAAEIPTEVPTESVAMYANDVLTAFDLDYATQYSESWDTEVTSFQMAGKEYKNGTVFQTSTLPGWGGNDKYSSISYRNEGDYSKISFYLGHEDNTAMEPIELKIYLDNKLYETYSMSANDVPKMIEIDVKGRQIIRFEAIKSYDTGYCLADLKIE